MKRFAVRLSIVGGLVILGLIAIAQAQRPAEPREPQETAAAATARPATRPEQKPGASGSSNSDPFAAARLLGGPGETPGRLASTSAASQPTATSRSSPPDSQAPTGREMETSGDDWPPATRGDRQSPASGAPSSLGDRYASPGRSILAADPGDESTDRSLTRDPSLTRGVGAATAEPAAGDGAADSTRGLPYTSGNPLPASQRDPSAVAEPAAPPASGSYMPGGAVASRGAEPGEPAPLEPDPRFPPRPVDARLSLETFPGGAAGSEPGPAGIEGTGRPGQKQLEGVQTPALAIEKRAPAEVQIGKPAVFEIQVSNTGAVAAQGVTIRDQVPRGTRLASARPQAEQGADGSLLWSLGSLEPGEERTVQLELVPTEEGEIGSVATVNFAAQSSVRTFATRPELAIELATVKEVMIGESLALRIRISNPGTGPATGVVLRENVPENLTHEAGTELEYEVGELKPNETRELELILTAARAGRGVNLLTARGDGDLRAEKQTPIEVIAPSLALRMEGPKRRYLEREATYTVSVSNPGTAAATNVDLVAYLPEGMDFVKADNYGQYDSAARAVRWSLEELPPQETGSVTLTAMPVEAGEQKVVIEGTADLGLSAKEEQQVVVEGVAAILFQVADVQDPVEAGGETAYEIRVVNQGSKAASDVRLVVELPPQMQALGAEGPTPHLVEGNLVRFEPLARLAPKADTTYRVRVQGLMAGDMRMRAQLVTNEITTPVIKEESTRVYADE